MEVKIETTVTVSMVLTGEEARWLRGHMQNPLGGQHLDQEDSTSKRIRADIWNRLAPVGL